MKHLSFKKVSPAEVEILKKISITTYREQFEKDNNPEDFQLYLGNAFSRSTLLDEINNPESVFYFVFSEKKLAGYLKLNSGNAQTEIRKSDTMELERIYLYREFQGQKLGKQMIEKALDEARNANCSYLWLGVWEHNHRAIKFYKDLGFTSFSSHSFFMGTDEQTDILMKLKL